MVAVHSGDSKGNYVVLNQRKLKTKDLLVLQYHSSSEMWNKQAPNSGCWLLQMLQWGQQGGLISM